ncbi:MAG: hypothetical protein ACKO1W_11465 [Microcystaceae cyanobacterium]
MNSMDLLSDLDAITETTMTSPENPLVTPDNPDLWENLTALDASESLTEFEDLFQTLTLVDEGEALDRLMVEEPQHVTLALLPPFLQQYQQLQATVEPLKQDLAQAQQQLTAQERRLRSDEDLLGQQAAEIGRSREQLAEAVAEMQVYQEEAKRQRLQIEQLTEQLMVSERRIQELEQAYQALQGTMEQDHQTIQRLEQQAQELRSRLQRQQRYALQYKTALEQYLANPNFNPSSDIQSAIASVAPSSTIQPWSKETSGETSPAPVPPVETLEAKAEMAEPVSASLTISAETTIGDLLALESATPATLDTPSKSPVESSFSADPSISPANLTETPLPQTEAPAAVESVETLPEETRQPLPVTTALPPVHRRSKLSFAIESQRTPRKMIDLPRFVRQPVSQT